MTIVRIDYMFEGGRYSEAFTVSDDDRDPILAAAYRCIARGRRLIRAEVIDENLPGKA